MDLDGPIKKLFLEVAALKAVDWVIVVLVVVVALEGLLFAGVLAGIINISGGPGIPGGVSVNIGGSTISMPATNEGSSSAESGGEVHDLCGSFTRNYPTYFFVKEQQCGLHGGTFVCEASRVGCYDITSWDSAFGCASDQVQVLKAACSVLGGEWVCTAVRISCEI